MTAQERRISLTEAIDHAGPVIFGPDWIDRLKPRDAAILEKFGPKPFGQPKQSIGPCPRQWQVKLDRAIGRDVRLVVQRATVLDWIFSARVMTSPNHCDPAAIDRALSRYRPTKAGVGAPPRVRHRVITSMLHDIHTGKMTLDSLEGLKEEALADMYGASRRTCKEALIFVKAEAKRRGL